MWTVDHAVVVGAGIGGLTASLVLSRVAARVTLVERAERPSEVGAALALQPNGMAVRRRPLARRVQKTAAMLQRLCGIQQVTTRLVRDALLAGLTQFPRLSEEVIRRTLAADVRTVRSASLLGDAR